MDRFNPSTEHQLAAFERPHGRKVLVECKVIIGIDWFSLPTGTRLVVDTRNSTYCLLKLDGEFSNALVRGGSWLETETVVRVEGSTAGRSPIKIGWILKDLRLEISIGRERLVTSSVRSIKVEAVPFLSEEGERRSLSDMPRDARTSL